MSGVSALSIICCSYAKGTDALNTFTTNRELPRPGVVLTCQTRRCSGKGPTAGAGSRFAVKPASIPLFTVRSNSASVISGGACRMLTLASPAGVASSKFGRSACVAGEPTQAETAVSANNDKMDEVRMAFTSLVDEIMEQRGLPIELRIQAVHENMRRPQTRTPNQS